MPRHDKKPLIGFAPRLYGAWIDSNLSQGQIGLACGVDRKTISAYVNGASVPDATTLGKLCKALKVSTDYLLFGEGGGGVEK